MKLFVTGANGQLGYDVVREAIERGHSVVASDVAETLSGNWKDETLSYVSMDITDERQVREALLYAHPDAVIHCAAWTAVDAAELPENIPMVHRINAEGTKNIAECCKDIGCKMIYISTDYVFDGQGCQPWEAGCKDRRPLNEYGKSKWKGEVFVEQLVERFFIVRIAWVFGLNGNNFVKTMLSVGKKYDTVRVVNDQIGTPTYTFHLSKLLLDMVNTDRYGYYHATNSGGYISWYDFCCEIFRLAGYSTKVLPVTTQEYGLAKAKRPQNSRLDCSELVKNGFHILPHWKDALSDYLNKIL